MLFASRNVAQQTKTLRWSFCKFNQMCGLRKIYPQRNSATWVREKLLAVAHVALMPIFP
jgi:hypothetical protein